MLRFVFRENIRRFQNALLVERDEAARRTIRLLMADAQRRLAEADALAAGIAGWVRPARQPISQFQDDFETTDLPYLLIDPSAGLHIVDVNAAYGRATMVARKAIVGERLFDAFPDNPDDPSADGVSNLYASLKNAAETGKPHTMAVQRYDVRDAAGRFIERYWRPRNTPLFDTEGKLIFLLHHVEDITHQVLKARCA